MKRVFLVMVISAMLVTLGFTQTPAAGNGSYTVKKGDTLYRIAKDHYGDGKQWTKIASANPGVICGAC